MPGPVLKSKPFPGLDQLPDPVRSAIETVFPQEPDPSLVAPMTSVIGGVGKRALSSLPRSHPSASRISELRNLITSVRDALTPAPIDPLREVLSGRVTPRKLPHRIPIKPPEGFELQGMLPYADRHPDLVELFVQQQHSEPFGNVGGKRIKNARTTLPTGADGSKRIRQEISKGIASPSGTLEDVLLAAKSTPQTPRSAPPLSGYFSRNKRRKP